MVSDKRTEELRQITAIESVIKEAVKEEHISKELFKTENIQTKTELTGEETSIVARLKYLCDELELDNFKKALDNLLELRISKGRKGRKEFIESLKQQQTLINPNNSSGFSGGRMGGL